MSGAEQALQDAVLGRLRSEAPLEAEFGSPPRFYHERPPRSAFPYLEIGNHEIRHLETRSSGPLEHRLQLVIVSRRGGRAEAKELLAKVRGVLETADLQLSDHRLVLFYPVFADALQARDGTNFRGVLRLRAITEPNTP